MTWAFKKDFDEKTKKLAYFFKEISDFEKSVFANFTDFETKIQNGTNQLRYFAHLVKDLKNSANDFIHTVKLNQFI